MLRSLPVLVALAALALPAAAVASTAENGVMDGRMHVTAKPGETNVITITREDIALPHGVWDTAGVTTSSCIVKTPTYVQCAAGSPIVRLADGDDQLTYHDDTSDFPIGPADVEGGTGDDTIRTADSADLVDGGPGKDTINGYLGDDVLRGGDGDDTVRGEFGADTIVGGAGADLLVGGMEDDTIDARDGEIDAVRCDEGADTVEADAADVVHADCETVRRPAPAGEKPGPGPDPGKPGDEQPKGGGTGPALRVVEPGPAGPLPEGRPQPVPGPQPVPAGDRRAPRLTVVSAKRRAGRVTLTVRCDEACRVSGKAGRKTVRRSLRANADGRLVLRGRRVVLTATDAAGNVTRRTVKR